MSLLVYVFHAKSAAPITSNLKFMKNDNKNIISKAFWEACGSHDHEA